MLDRQPANSYVSSITALALGIVLAVGVSAFFGLQHLRGDANRDLAC
jgi:hypothetical protein